jgi:cation transport ATPase
VHKVFNDPVRDWFAAFLMGLLIVAGYLKWLPGQLSDGMLVCAAVIGLFPIVKNGLFDSIYKRTLRFELLVGILLLAGLFMGKFLEVALITLLLLIGSFMRLNFSWKD